jgi:hypothetical protein
MPLYDNKTPLTCSAEEAAAIVHAFVTRCLAWAEEQELPKTQALYDTTPTEALSARLRQWMTYRDFTRHTLQELEDGTLDRWFMSHQKSDE